MQIKIGILTTSDRAYAGSYHDLSGPEIQQFLTEQIKTDWTPVYNIVPDIQKKIEATLCHMVDIEKCCLIITSGGTGPAPSDVTPEATHSVCDRRLPGFGERMRSVSLKQTPTAILSRQEAVLRGQTLIINLPGKPRAIRQCLEAVFSAVPYCIELAGGPKIKIKE